MKVNLVNDNNLGHDRVSFEGYKPVKNKNGFYEYEFSYPFDPERQNCKLEIFKLGQDSYNNYYTAGIAYNRAGVDGIYLKEGGTKVNLARDYGITVDTPFAYRYIITNKDGSNAHVEIDAGDSINEKHTGDFNIFNVVHPLKSGLSRGGNMKLVIPDSQKVGTVYNDQNVIVEDKNLKKHAQNVLKTITNKFGGTLAGLEKAVRDGEYDSYNRIISLPIFTDDDFSAHSYWNKNCFQIANSLGNINNYASLQREMFAHGLNFVSDGAFVNEGLQGVHFQHVLRWGEDSPYFNWFKGQPLLDGPWILGAFPKKSEVVSHKIVNGPYIYHQTNSGKIVSDVNKHYNPNKPTYFQFFDKNCVTEDEKNDPRYLIKSYSKQPKNVYASHTHNDSIFPYYIEINPKEYDRNVKRLNEYNSYQSKDDVIKLDDYKAARFLSKFENWNGDGKFESGFETWDANPDIVKLNFVYSNADTKAMKNLSPELRKFRIEKLKRANSQVQDYTVESGKYWTKTTADIYRMYIAQKLKDIDADNPSLAYSKIMKLVNEKSFPTSLKHEISKDEVQNVIYNLYKNTRSLSKEDKNSQILEGLMNTPLDSFEFGDNIVAVLASPMISKRASVPEEVGVSRYDLYKAGNPNLAEEYSKPYIKMENLYKTEMQNFALKVLDNVDSKLPQNSKLFNGDKVTEYGQYVLPLVLPQIAKYAVVKSISPKTEVRIDKNSGEISYDYKNLKELSLQGIGIKNPASPQDEALTLISVMKSGMNKLSASDIEKAIEISLKGTNAESFKLADLIIDKTQSGLDWRIDATKDIADIEALRNGNTNFDYTWNTVIDFWKKFISGVQKYNSNAYTVAEVTNEIGIYNDGWGSKSNKFNPTDIIPKFLRETGLTSIANYSAYYNDIIKMFTPTFEKGETLSSEPNELTNHLYRMLIKRDGAFLKSSSLESILYSYTFVGNHDKARALHCSALDMGMFYADLTYTEDKTHRMEAYKLIKNDYFREIPQSEVDDYNFNAVSPKAIAMGIALRKSFMDVLNKYKDEGKLSEQDFNNAFIAISKSVSDLAQGKFDGKRFEADAFGIKPIDVNIEMVLKQAREKYNLRMDKDLENTYSDDVFDNIMTPAIGKVKAMMEYLVALPGMPTLFDGDDMGSTGYDSETKNMYLQGRQRVHDEWADQNSPKYKKLIADNKKDFDKIMSVRKNPKCNALNNGAPFVLPEQDARVEEYDYHCNIPAVFRQATDGRLAISLFNTTGGNHLELDSVKFNFDKDGTIMDGSLGIGISGIKNGTKFVNANDENDVYYVNEFDGKYFLKRGSGDGKIRFNNPTMILYHVPENVPLSFTGNFDVKPPYKFVAKAYAQQI